MEKLSKQQQNQSPLKNLKNLGKNQMEQLMNQMDIDNLTLPKETLYLIDKLVRQRMSKGGPFGIQNSAVINLQMDQMRKANEENVSRLSCGRPIGLDQEGNPVYSGDDGNKENQNEQLYEKLGQACNQQEAQKPKKLTYDQWKRRKQNEERLRAKLIEDALNDLKESLVRKQAAKKLSAQSNQIFMKQWEETKKQYFLQKKQEEKLNQQRKTRQKQMKMAMSNRTYKNWQAQKFKILKQQNKRKAEQQRLQKELQEQKRKDEFAKRLAAQMSFKMWNKKLKKREKQQKIIKKLRQQQAERLLQQQKEKKKYSGVLLAYSLNKLMKKQPTGPPPIIRPSTASKIKKPKYFYENVEIVSQQNAYKTPNRQDNIRIEEKLIPTVDEVRRPRTVGKKKMSGQQQLQQQPISANKKVGSGGKSKKSKHNERPPPVGFEELSSIHPGHDQHSLEEPGIGFRSHKQID